MVVIGRGICRQEASCQKKKMLFGLHLALTLLLGCSIACPNFKIISLDNHEAISCILSRRTAYLSTHVATFRKAEARLKLKDARFAFSSRYATRR